MILPNKNKRKEIYVLDPKDIPHNQYYIKLEKSYYFDEDWEPIDCPADVGMWGDKPKLNVNYFMFKKGKVGILRNAKLDYSKEDDNGFIKGEDGTHEDPGYESANVVNQGFEWAIVFGDYSQLAFENSDDVTNAFIRGEFTVYIKDDK